MGVRPDNSFKLGGKAARRPTQAIARTGVRSPWFSLQIKLTVDVPWISKFCKSVASA